MAQTRKFPEFLEEMNIPGISGIDTRALTKLLRSHGTMKGMLVDAEVDIEEAKQRLHNTEITSQMVAEVSTSKAYPNPGNKRNIVLVDYGG